MTTAPANPKRPQVSACAMQLTLETSGDGDAHPLGLMLNRNMTRREEQMVLDAAARIMRLRYGPRKPMPGPQEAGEFFKSQLAHMPHEAFAVMFVDSHNCIIDTEVLFQGTIDGTEVHPRVVVARALELGATAILAAHQHPSGNPEPSAVDRSVTLRLKQALALFDVRLLDHIVVAGTQVTSMASRGWI